MPAWALILLAGAAAYANSLRAGFIFDDYAVVVQNPLIAHFWPLTDSFRNTIRPVVQLTFSVNHVIGGLHPAGYHAVNVLIHLLAALTLYGVLRRSLSNTRVPAAVARRAASLALATSLLWVVHPLTTQSVTYVAQRAESLMGLWYLLTLYAVIRSDSSPRRRRWEIFAVAACAAGMLTKATMATAPLMVLLYDRTMLSGSFRAAWQRRRFLYTGLAATWGLLAAVLIAVLPSHEPTVGFGMRGLSAAQYAATQPGVILHYLRLVFWPSGLCLDYGWPIASTARGILFPSLLIAGALGAVVAGVRRNRLLALAGAWCVLTLALTSSVIPIADLAAEHRMYLPLAGALFLIVLAADWALHRWLEPPAVPPAYAGAVLICVIALGIATSVRNRAYESEGVMWKDVAGKQPANARARNNLGLALAAEGRLDAAQHAFAEAVRLSPAYADAHYNLGLVYAKRQNWEKSAAYFREALRLDPGDDGTWLALGIVLAAKGDVEGAIRYYEEALRINPRSASAHNNLGNALIRLGRQEAGIRQLRQAAALAPRDPNIRDNLDRALQTIR